MNYDDEKVRWADGYDRLMREVLMMLVNGNRPESIRARAQGFLLVLADAYGYAVPKVGNPSVWHPEEGYVVFPFAAPVAPSFHQKLFDLGVIDVQPGNPLTHWDLRLPVSGPGIQGIGVAQDPLTFAELRRVNVQRCESVFHRLADWSPNDWGCAVGGELGELLNLMKKLRRASDKIGKFDLNDERLWLEAGVTREQIAHELADTAIYLDLLAAIFCVDLGEAIREKFNIVSERRGSNIRL